MMSTASMESEVLASGFAANPLSFMRTGSFDADFALRAFSAFTFVNLHILTLGKLPQHSDFPEPQPHRFSRSSTPTGARWHVTPDVAASGDLGAGADLEVTQDPNLAAKSNKITEFSTA